MSNRLKVPERLQELATDLELGLGDEIEFTTDPEGLIASLRHRNEEMRVEDTEHRDDIDRELDELEAEMLENADDA